VVKLLVPFIKRKESWLSINLTTEWSIILGILHLILDHCRQLPKTNLFDEKNESHSCIHECVCAESISKIRMYYLY